MIHLKSVPIIIALCANQNTFIRGQTLKSRSNWRSSRLACKAVDHVRAFDFTTSDSWGGLGCGAYKQHKHNILFHRLACDKALKSELWATIKFSKQWQGSWKNEENITFLFSLHASCFCWHKGHWHKVSKGLRPKFNFFFFFFVSLLSGLGKFCRGSPGTVGWSKSHATLNSFTWRNRMPL